MLAIRMQRTGRKGYAQFRIVVQDSRQTPSSARVIASIGHYNPHTKEKVIDSEKAKYYLKNGAQPSPRVVSLLKKEGVKMPSWVEPAVKQKKVTKNPEKLRKNHPKEPVKKEEPPKAAPEDAEVADEPVAVPQEIEETTTEVPTEAQPDEAVEEIAVEEEQIAESTTESKQEAPDPKKDVEPKKESKAPAEETK